MQKCLCTGSKTKPSKGKSGSLDMQQLFPMNGPKWNITVKLISLLFCPVHHKRELTEVSFALCKRGGGDGGGGGLEKFSLLFGATVALRIESWTKCAQSIDFLKYVSYRNAILAPLHAVGRHCLEPSSNIWPRGKSLQLLFFVIAVWTKYGHHTVLCAFEVKKQFNWVETLLR